MASRTEHKEALRQARLDAERRAARAERRKRSLRLAGGGVLVVGLAVATVVAASALSSDEATAGPFGTNHDGLDERLEDAGVATMGEAGGQVHYHPKLTVYASGERITVPANIGVDPSDPPAEMAGLHTHDDSGTIHVEATEGTLGQFFQVWGVPFSSTQLGPYEASGEEKIRMWVDGEPSRSFGDIRLADGQEIVAAYGTEDQLPPELSPQG